METHLTINEGYIDDNDSEERLEGQTIDIIGGETHINTNDDRINTSKIRSSNDEFGPGGMNRFNKTITAESGNIIGNSSQQPYSILIPNLSEQTETIIFNNTEESTTQYTIYSVSVGVSATIYNSNDHSYYKNNSK